MRLREPSQEDILGKQSTERVKRTLMGTSQEDISRKQSSGHSWLAVKRTTLGDNQVDTGQPWQTIGRTFVAHAKGQFWKTVNAVLGNAEPNGYLNKKTT